MLIRVCLRFLLQFIVPFSNSWTPQRFVQNILLWRHMVCTVFFFMGNHGVVMAIPPANTRMWGEGWHTAPWWLVENYMYKRFVGGASSRERLEHFWQFVIVLFDCTCVSFDFWGHYWMWFCFWPTFVIFFVFFFVFFEAHRTTEMQKKSSRKSGFVGILLQLEEILHLEGKKKRPSSGSQTSRLGYCLPFSCWP